MAGGFENKVQQKPDSDTDSGSSLTSCSAECVSSEVNYSPKGTICDLFGVVVVYLNRETNQTVKQIEPQ